MTRIWPESACIIALLFIGAGELAASDAWSPSTIPADDAGKSQVPLTQTFDGGFKRAVTQFRLGRFTEAERQFAWIVQVRKGTTWEERARYYLAECQYLQAKYVVALDNFERLYRDYPATEYLDKLVSREYEIARFWLAQSDARIPAGRKQSWMGRLDGRLPRLDIRGSALRRSSASSAIARTVRLPMMRPSASRILIWSSTTTGSPRSTTTNSLRPISRVPFGHARLSAIEARILAYLDSVRTSRSS